MRRFLCAAMVAVLARAARADDSRTSAAMFLKDDPSPRAAALGGAWAALPGDASALFLNPAGLAAAPRSGAMAAQSLLPTDSSIQSAGVLVALPRLKGALACGVMVLQAGEFETRDVQGNYLGTAHAGAQAWSLAWGSSWGAERLGIRLKVLRERLGSDGGGAAAGDVGIQVPWGSSAGWGATLQNMGSRLKLGSSAEELPRALRVGFLLTPPWPGRPLFTADAVKPADGALSWNSGAELSIAPMLSVRAGWERVSGGASGATAGLGFFAFPAGRANLFRLDYAVTFTDAPGLTHRMSLSADFR